MQHTSRVDAQSKFVRFGQFSAKLCTVALALSFLIAPSVWAKGGTGGFAGVGLKIPNETVPAGGMLQMKILVTEPKPIFKARQRTTYSSSVLGTPSGIHLYSPAGDASGVAVLNNGGAPFFLSSPFTSFGTVTDYPVITMAIPVKATATTGQKVSLTLDPTLANWLDPSSNPYPLDLKSGVMTVGGTLSISDVAPGSGVVAAGSPISIKGIGFQPNSQIRVKNAIVATSQYVSANLIRITLASATDMDTRQVQVKNPSTNEQATYFSYQRTTAIGASKHTLVAASYPLFSRAQWKLGYFKPVLSGTVFSALSLQNMNAIGTVVRLDLTSSTGTLLASQLVPLGASSVITRDLKEFFPAATAATGTEVKLSSAIPVQALGLVGDDASGIVLPVELSSIP
jgi:hypothetical protein